MAGYIFALGKDSPLDIFTKCAQDGVYSTYISSLGAPFEGTFADYSTMKEGDNIYFFFDRKIYGIGTLINIRSDCKFSNYPDSCKLTKPAYHDINARLLVDYGEESAYNPWICIFRPSPYFFTTGVDMDDVLSYKPNTFKILRAFWKVSFIKIGEEENQSLKEIILLRNQESLCFPNDGNTLLYDETKHREIENHITDNHYLNITDLLSCCSNGSWIRHEMAIEAALLYKLSTDYNTIFGRWDYLSHQIPASPFKPIDYMDRMDVFGARFLNDDKVISKYLVVEIKKNEADVEALIQVMKYVDWVCNEYAYDDYSMIEAYVLAYSFKEEAIAQYRSIGVRNYTIGTHPIDNRKWDSLKLIRYEFDGNDIKFYEV